MTITVIKPGLQSTIQSRPRVGLRHQGVPASGAADPLSLALANRLLGNTWEAPAIEATLLGPTLRFDCECSFSVTGAVAVATLNGNEIQAHESLTAITGDKLTVGAAEVGARMYIAVTGGFAAEDVLGSSSTNLQAGFGGLQGRALIAGDVLRFEPSAIESARTPEEYRLPMSSTWALRTCIASETDSLDDASLDNLFSTNWTVDRRADRMGVRLDGPKLEPFSVPKMDRPMFSLSMQARSGVIRGSRKLPVLIVTHWASCGQVITCVCCDENLMKQSSSCAPSSPIGASGCRTSTRFSSRLVVPCAVSRHGQFILYAVSNSRTRLAI
jgi:allophanate hydrolase